MNETIDPPPVSPLAGLVVKATRVERVCVRARGAGHTFSAWALAAETDQGPGSIVRVELARGDGSGAATASSSAGRPSGSRRPGRSSGPRSRSPRPCRNSPSSARPSLRRPAQDLDLLHRHEHAAGGLVEKRVDALEVAADLLLGVDDLDDDRKVLRELDEARAVDDARRAVGLDAAQDGRARETRLRAP